MRVEIKAMVCVLMDDGRCFAGGRRPKRRSWRGFCSCRSPRSNATAGALPGAAILIYSLLFNLFFCLFFLNSQMLSYSRYLFFSHEIRANKHVRVVSVTVETLRDERKSLVFLLSIFHHLMSFMK